MQNVIKTNIPKVKRQTEGSYFFQTLSEKAIHN